MDDFIAAYNETAHPFEWGPSNDQIAAAMKTRPATASKWRGRFLREPIKGLQDAPRPGKPATYDVESERRILTQLDQPLPKGYAR
jgi:transposase